MSEPPRLHCQPLIPFSSLSLSILPPQISHLRKRQRAANNHGAQTHTMPERIMRRVLLQVDERAYERAAIRD